MSENNLECYFKKGQFLYDIYQQNNVGPERCKLEAEVTPYAVEKYKEYYQCYQDLEIGNEGKETKQRRQMSTCGCYLTKNDKSIDIVADILTSMNEPIKTCLKNMVKVELTDEDVYNSKKHGKLIIGNCEDYQEFDSELLRSINAFIKVNYTIGNMIPIPEGLNTTWSKPDNAAAKIEHLQDYFKKKKDENLKEKYKDDTSKVEDLIEKHSTLGTGTNRNGVCALWLTEYFAKCTWQCFVEHNFLQDFFDGGDNEYKDVNVVSYPAGENTSDPLKWIEWFDAMTKCIIRRGYRMSHGGKTIDQNELEDIMKYL